MFQITEFQNPPHQFRPGTRWRWPGAAVDKTILQDEINYLSEKGFGYVEINPFGVKNPLPGDEERVADVYRESFFENLAFAVSCCQEKGITVDLNMGSGWNANAPQVTLADSMGNMALGRETRSTKNLHGLVAVPAPEKSLFYVSGKGHGVWDERKIKLQGILIARHTGREGRAFKERQGRFMAVPAYKAVFDADGNVVKEYEKQIVLDPACQIFLPADSSMLETNQFQLTEDQFAQLGEGICEVTALYYLPSGAKALECAPKWYAADHLNASAIIKYMQQWLGLPGMERILSQYDNVRAVFNDSYEFYTDCYYTDDLPDLAADAANNGLGYDFSPYLATLYRQYGAAPFYMGLGTSDTYLTFAENDDEKQRIYHDYALLINQKFMEGMAAFAQGAAKEGLVYRQEAYNPPIDTIKSARFIDIPEAEQADEMALIRTSSGAHLYGKNLVTCEQYTLGCVPLRNTPEMIKTGYDLMATSGVNNFFYHGLMYGYGVDSAAYGELGWSPFPAIGINVSSRNTLAHCLGGLNQYAARTHYLMQLGKVSKDAAVYMPFNGSLRETDGIRALNRAGFAWDAINDDSICAADTLFINGKISVNGGNLALDLIIVETDILPVQTMRRLLQLAKAGASIIFQGVMPDRQPGYCGGAYREQDKQVAALAEKILTIPTASLTRDEQELEQKLRTVGHPAVAIQSNDYVRIFRRTLSDGSEIVYLRNTGKQDNRITVQINHEYKAFYWLDLFSGTVCPAERNDDGTITCFLRGGNDCLSGMFGLENYSMAAVLLCDQRSMEVKSTQKLPLGMIRENVQTISLPVEMTSLTITADNLTGLEGNIVTRVFSDQVLGKWNDSAFNQGLLRFVADTGCYEGTFLYSDDIKSHMIMLDLGEVHSAATITINGRVVGQCLFTPYEIDITPWVENGLNKLKIDLIPRKYNRIYGKTGPLPGGPTGPMKGEDGSHLVDTGLAGPVTVRCILTEYVRK